MKWQQAALPQTWVMCICSACRLPMEMLMPFYNAAVYNV